MVCAQLEHVKQQLHEHLLKDEPVEKLISDIAPLLSPARVEALRCIQNPRKGLDEMRRHLTNITEDFYLASTSEVKLSVCST